MSARSIEETRLLWEKIDRERVRFSIICFVMLFLAAVGLAYAYFNEGSAAALFASGLAIGFCCLIVFGERLNNKWQSRYRGIIEALHAADQSDSIREVHQHDRG